MIDELKLPTAEELTDIDLYLVDYHERGWDHDPRLWPERLATATVLGSFLPGDLLAGNRLFDLVVPGAYETSIKRWVMAFWSALHLNDVPRALTLCELDVPVTAEVFALLN